MKDILLKTESAESIIHCGKGAFEKYAPLFKGKQLFVVTDDNLNALYESNIKRAFGEYKGIVLKAGEESKSSENLLKILKTMLDCGMRRNCIVVAFGGGVIGDIAGLAASLYMRGAGLLQIPTTLLSQVDSSVGGKTAVDMGGVKNVIGTFYQPKEVIVDPSFLSTLPEREINCGLGEINKYGALDKSIYSKLVKNIENLYSEEFLDGIIYDCISHKSKVVEEDEKDLTGARKTLNLGHTTGHAFELYYGGKSHGEFVLIGMYYELQIARKKGICGGQYADNLEKLILKVLKKIPAYRDVERAAEFALHDKKNDDERISVIVPKIEGKSAELKLYKEEYKQYLIETAAYVGGNS